jgi:Ni/Fe-hydrogenase subunit HybB-like protein
VALCVMAYVGVLWIELGPAFLEKWQGTSKRAGLQSFAKAGLKFYDKALIWIIALGLLLPTMHQSSLGTLMLLAGDKLHGLWYTPWIPLLFLISCIGMGYAVVVWESALSHRLFKREVEREMLISLSGAMVLVVALYLVLRFGDLIIAGKIPLMFTSGWLSFVFWIEIALFAVPMVILASKQRRNNFSNTLNSAILLMLAGGVYRFNAYITAYNPAPGQTYFPSFLEVYITVGVIALEITLYYIIVKRYPIIGGLPADASAK